jgi:hypothetical protein
VWRTAFAAMVVLALGARPVAACEYDCERELLTCRNHVLVELDTPIATDVVIAYREGRWLDARDLALADANAPISQWVLAKLAARDDDLATAEYHLAVLTARILADPASFPDDDAFGRTAARVHGERAIVALADDRPVDAMHELWSARDFHPLDAIYVAERILTIDELQRFVDDFVSPPTSTAPGVAGVPASTRIEPRAIDLHGVLARRLARGGRLRDALPYFAPSLRPTAIALDDAYRASQSNDRVERAQALFAASAIVREHGLELLGTEHAPDWALYDGGHDPYAIDGGEGDGSLITDAERERVAASAPLYEAHRYHYRFVASDLAERGADLLPRRSQAFAAMLCHATSYIFDDDPARREALYRRYVRDGATVDFAGHFGHGCPSPDVAGARRYLGPPAWMMRAPLAFGAIACVLLMIAWLSRRRSVPSAGARCGGGRSASGCSPASRGRAPS